MSDKERTKDLLTLLFVLFVGAVLVIGLGLEYEDKQESEVKRYLEENYEETGSVNLIESVLLDLRAYDTFGEVIILYIAIAGVIILGKEMRKKSKNIESDEAGDEE